tara:strand:+ start:45 stop:605 length:561 start_codon:yes stop_codon:yes gene_type:complete
MSKKIVALFGAPGSGKGTQANSIKLEYQLPILSIGQLIRAEINAQTEFGNQVEKSIERGELVTDDLIIDFIEKELNKEKFQEGFISDGFPRTKVQCEFFEKYFNGSGHQISYIYLEVDQESVQKRIEKRKLEVNRTDDGRKIVIKRLKQFYNEIEQIKQYYQEKLVLINGNQPVNSVYNEIKKIIK